MPSESEAVPPYIAGLWLLQALFENGPMDVADLALETHSHPDYIDICFGELSPAGYIESHTVEANGIELWRLTPKGRRAVAIWELEIDRGLDEFRARRRSGTRPTDPMVPDQRPKRRWFRRP